MWHALARRRIDRYFEGRLGRSSEARMRRHLGACDDCRARYQRHLLAEAALPDGERRAEDRGWQGILAAAQAPAHAAPAPRAMRLALPVLAVAGAAAAALVLVPRLRDPAEPVERGGPSSGAPAAPALHLFRAVPGGTSAPLGDRVRAGDGWLVAYSNPGAEARWLMVLAVDEACGVHWFYPAYERAGEDPAAVPIRTGAEGVELGEEIRHQLRPGRLALVGLFLARPLGVLAVEEAVRRQCSAGAAWSACAPLALPAVHQTCRPLAVDP